MGGYHTHTHIYIHTYTERKKLCEMATAHHFSLKKSLANFSLTLHHGEVPAATIGQLLQIREIKDACPDLFESWAQRSQRLT